MESVSNKKKKMYTYVYETICFCSLHSISMKCMRLTGKFFSIIWFWWMYATDPCFWASVSRNEIIFHSFYVVVTVAVIVVRTVQPVICYYCCYYLCDIVMWVGKCVRVGAPYVHVHVCGWLLWMYRLLFLCVIFVPIVTKKTERLQSSDGLRRGNTSLIKIHLKYRSQWYIH